MYDEIYRRRWDKDTLMHALLGGDGATVTFVKYEDNKRSKEPWDRYSNLLWQIRLL